MEGHALLYLNLVQVGAEVIGRRKYFDCVGLKRDDGIYLVL